MADVRTLKQGHLYVLPGQAEPIGAETGVSYPCGFVESDGTHGLLYVKSGDMHCITGNSFLTLNSGTPSAVLNATYNIVRPVCRADGTTIHCWYAYDPAGASAWQIWYTKSTDSGATWDTPVAVISLGLGGSWNDAWMRPVGVHDDGTTLTLHVEGDDGINGTLGVWTASSGADYSSSGSYTPYGSNPVTGSIYYSGTTQFQSVVYHRGAYHWYGNSANTGNKALAYARSDDGITWTPAEPNRVEPVWDVGASGSKDDSHAIAYGGYSDGSKLWLFYNGSDGSTLRNFAAVGEQADRLYKVAGLEVTALPTELPYCTGDLTYQEASKIQHMMDRMGPGALAESVFEPFGGSFSYRLTTKPTEYVTPDPGVNDDGQTVNLLYVLDGDDGTEDQWVLFPKALVNWDFSEAEDGDLVNVSFMCYGTSTPAIGAY